MSRPTRDRRGIAIFVLALACALATPRVAGAYSVLAHQAIVDAAWDASIVPALRARFHPSSADLKRARAFAYGGSLIQDIGYYPFSSRFFGDLTHYVRSGDFIESLLREAADVTEYAFALGALAHYAADNDGHPLAVNRAVPALYPKLRAKFGDDVTYAQNPAAHLKTEFGFDVVQVDAASRSPVLENRNFDTGRPVKAGDYPLVDATYARLVETLAKRREAGGAAIPGLLLANIRTFYANLDAPIDTRKHKKQWTRLLRDLDRIKKTG